MSRRSLGAAAIAVALSALPLAACQSTFGTQTGPISSGTGTAAKVVRGAQDVCQYLPTAATVTRIIAAADPTATTVADMVGAICAAVAPLASGPGSSLTPGYAYGVKVRGRFAR